MKKIINFSHKTLSLIDFIKKTEGHNNFSATVISIISNYYKKEYFDNWIYKEGIALHIDENLIQYPVAILKNINIEEEYRNQGYGNQGMREFLDAVYEAKNIFLMVDIGESNSFILLEWYKSFGFEQVGRAGDYPVMMLKQD